MNQKTLIFVGLAVVGFIFKDKIIETFDTVFRPERVSTDNEVS